MEFLNSAKIDGDKLVATPVPMPGEESKPATEIAFADFGTSVAMVEADRDAKRRVFMTVRGDLGDRALLAGLSLDKIKAKAPALVEIPAMTASIPFDVVYHDGKLDKAGTDKFLHEVFTAVASGKPEDHGYNIRTLLNPAAVDHVEDKGAYRTISLKAAFGTGHSEVETPLAAPEIKARLGISAPGL